MSDHDVDSQLTLWVRGVAAVSPSPTQSVTAVRARRIAPVAALLVAFVAVLGAGGLMVVLFSGPDRTTSPFGATTEPAPIDNESPSTETTLLPIVPESDLDPGGLASHRRINADGVVTDDEFREAVRGMVACMESRGVLVEEWEVRAAGEWSLGYQSNDEELSDSVYNVCYQSYVLPVE